MSKSIFRGSADSAGFTAVELLIVVVIIALVMAMAVPAYQTIISGAQMNTAVSDLENISKAIDIHVAQTGQLPETLADVGFEELTDPWGNAYQYLPLAEEEGQEQLVTLDASGEMVLVAEVEAVAATEREGTTTTKTKNGAFVSGRGEGRNGSELPVLAGGSKKKKKTEEETRTEMDLPDGTKVVGSSFSTYVDKIIARKNADGEVSLDTLINPTTTLPLTFKFVYLSRKGVSLHPLNTDYDLFSMGIDQDSEAAITDPLSEDDVVRANNGKFIGPVTNL